mgnify:CR=1 FL=1
MKLQLYCSDRGLVPCYDEDYDKSKMLVVGQTYDADIKVCRNPAFHRKFFALINCAWEYLSEGRRAGFRTKDNFRKYLEVAAGFCEPFYSPKRGEWVEIPKSIEFGRMDNAEFEALYNGVRGVIDSLLASIVSKEEFDKYLARF